jgi:hypothetical protein
LIPYIGDFAVNSTLRYFYASNAAGGASAARTTAGTYRVYKNISTTERTSSAGITDFSGFDSVTGLNAVTIDLSNNTDAGFYAAGNDYVVVLVGAVVDSQTVNVPLFQFSIANRAPTVTVSSMAAGVITNTAIANNAIILRLANDALPSNARFTTYDTFSGYPLLSQSAQHQISVTGAHHAAADVHEFQPNVITNNATDASFIAEVADAVWDELASGHSIANSFGKLLANLAAVYTGITGVVTSTVTATFNTFSTSLTALDDTYNEQTIVFTTGACAGQSVPVTDFNQLNGYITTEDPFTSEPQPGDVFSIIPIHIHKRTQIADALLNRLLDSTGSSFDVMNERTVRSALRAMRNRVIVASGNISVYKEDDQTAAWEGTLSNTANVTVNPDGGTV